MIIVLRGTLGTLVLMAECWCFMVADLLTGGGGGGGGGTEPDDDGGNVIEWRY